MWQSNQGWRDWFPGKEHWRTLVLIKQGCKGRETSCAALDGLIPSEAFRGSCVYAWHVELGTAVGRAVHEPNFMARSKGRKSMLGLLGRCTPLWVGNVRISQVTVELGSALSARNSPAAQLGEKGWSSAAVPSTLEQQEQCCASSKPFEGSAALWGGDWEHWEELTTQRAQLPAYLTPTASLAEWCSMDKLCLTLDLASQTLFPCDRRGFTSGRGSAAGDPQPAEPWPCQHKHLIWDRSGHVVLFLGRSQSRWDEVHAAFVPTLLQQWEDRHHLTQQKALCENLSKILR